MWIISILGAVATYLLWGDMTWLAVVTIFLVLVFINMSYKQPQNNGAGFASFLIIIIFIYSLF